MKAKYLKTFKPVVLGIAVSVSLMGCSFCESDEPDPFAGKIDSSYLEDYLSGETSSEKSDGISVYLDMSGGIYEAQRVVGINIQNRNILNMIQSESSATIWSVGESKVTKLAMKNTDLFTYLAKEENYSKDYAPIDLVLDSVVSKKENALIISDFELWTSGKSPQWETAPYAQSFKEWVNAGNRIDIYSSKESFSDGNSKNKRLYFVVFSKKDDSKLLEMMEGENKTAGMDQLTIDARAWNIKPNYASASSVGLVHPDLSTPSFFDKEDQERGDKYEVIKLKNNGISGMLASKKEAGQLKLDFIDQLFIDFNASDVFKLKDLKVGVSDISEDYESFCKEVIAKKEGGKIKTIKDDKQKPVWDNETRGNAIIRSCFEDNGDSSDLKEEFKYSPKEAKKIVEFLEIDSEVLTNTKDSDPSRVQLRLNLHKNFDPKKVFENFKLYKIEIMVSSVEPNSSIADSYAWDYDGNKNTTFSTSIENTISGVKAEQTLYTIYLVNTNEYK